MKAIFANHRQLSNLDKFVSFPPLLMYKNGNIVKYFAAVSRLVGVFESLSYDADLKNASLLNTAVQKHSPIMIESWSLFTVQQH